MQHTSRKDVVAQRVRSLPKSELFIHLLTALRNECYLYAGILRDEIQDT